MNLIFVVTIGILLWTLTEFKDAKKLFQLFDIAEESAIDYIAVYYRITP